MYGLVSNSVIEKSHKYKNLHKSQNEEEEEDKNVENEKKTHAHTLMRIVKLI